MDEYEVPEVVESEVEVSTIWGYPSSIDPESVVLLGKDDIGLVLESDAKTKKPVLCKYPHYKPVYHLGGFLNAECFEKINRFYAIPDYKDILVDEHSGRKNEDSQSPPAQQHVSKPDDTDSQCGSNTLADVPDNSDKRPCSPLNNITKQLKQETDAVPPPVTTYKDLGLCDSSGAYICIYCPRTFLTMNEMKAHCSSDHDAKPFKCKICGNTFSSSRSLLVHTLVHTGEKHIKCSYCDASFRQTGHRNSHVKLIHGDEYPYKCTQCPAGFRAAVELNHHTKQAHLGQSIQCSACSKVFLNGNQMKMHNCAMRHRDKTCTPCGERFYRIKDLLRHARCCKQIDQTDLLCEKCEMVFECAARCSIHKSYLCNGMVMVKSEMLDSEDVTDNSLVNDSMVIMKEPTDLIT